MFSYRTLLLLVLIDPKWYCHAQKLQSNNATTTTTTTTLSTMEKAPEILFHVLPESETSPNVPLNCNHRFFPMYHMEKENYNDNDNDASAMDHHPTTYKLVINLYPITSPKRLHVDVNYDTGLIQVSGWIDPNLMMILPTTTTTTNAKPNNKENENHLNKSCMYQEWKVFTSSTGSTSSTSAGEEILKVPENIHELVMQRLDDGTLILSIPRPPTSLTPPLPAATSKKSKSPISSSLPSTHFLRGLGGVGRISTITTTGPTLHHDNYDDGNQNDVFSSSYSHLVGSANKNRIIAVGNTNTNIENTLSLFHQQQKDALERFLAVSLSHTDEETYWLHKM